MLFSTNITTLKYDLLIPGNVTNLGNNAFAYIAVEVGAIGRTADGSDA